MRCPDCNKFVAYDEPEVEFSGSSDVSDHDVTCTVTITLKCADCGTDLKSAEVECVGLISHTCDKPESAERSEQFECESTGDFEGEDRLQAEDRNGRPIRNPRYMKKFYGARADVNLKCTACEEEFTVSVHGEAQASEFDELV